jgi:ectoine hydroxylase-related dioxygenase (phytanoyl-CoA dioxygenase family)
MLNRQPGHEIATAEVARFHDDGAVLLRGMFDADWLELLADAVERDKAEPGPMVRYNTPAGASGEFFVDFQLWSRWDGARRFVYDSPAAEIMATMMESERVNFYHDHLLVKEPGTAERTPWHHDQPYYPVNGRQVASIWLPLDPVPKEICVEYIAGSHRWERWFAPQYFNQDNTALKVVEDRFETIPDFDAERGKHQLLSWALEPGDCIVFHALVVHSAPGNPSPAQRRRAYATRWLGDDARYAERSGQTSPPITGHGLEPGDPMDCPIFPQIWPRHGA